MSSARTVLLIAGLASASLVAPALADKPGDTDTTKTSKGAQTRNCSGGTVVFSGPQILWPPNHKMVTETATATSKPTTAKLGSTSITLNAAAVEDVVGGDGSPQEGPDSSGATTGNDTDGDGVASADYDVRAERSGKGDGRTYTIDWTATFDDGSSCSSEMATPTDAQQAPFVITVPHDQGNH